MANILVIDSSLLDRKRMCGVLEAAGHSVAEMVSPAQAMDELPALPQGSVDLVLTELHFDTESGFDLIRWLKGHPILTGVPVLVVTPQPPREQVIELVKVGASTIIAKPFGGDLLLRRVTEALTEYIAARQGEGERVSWQVDDYVRRELKRAARRQLPFSVVVCHLSDGLHGRAVPLLMGGLVQIMRETDVLIRVGETEVVILLPDTDSPGSQVVEAKVAAAASRLAVERKETVGLRLEVRTGAATFPGDSTEGPQLMAKARERSLNKSV